MLPPIFKIPPSGSFPPTGIKNEIGARSPALSHLRTLSYSHAWASFNFEWEGQSVSEVFAGVQEAGPQVGVEGGSSPYLRKFCIWWA